MNKLTFGALGVLVAFAAGGCATAYRVAEDAPGTQPPAVIAVSAMSADKGSSRLASSLRGSVESRLAERGMTVSSPQAANATVQLDVSRREAARLDAWRVYEGTARVRVMTAGLSTRLLSETTVSAVGSRALDEVKAEQGVLDGLTKKVNGWLDGVVKSGSFPVVQPIPPAGCMNARISFSLAVGSANDNEFLDAQIAFRSAVSNLPGVRSCRQSIPASSARYAVYDIVYETNSFPDGVVNTIVAKLREKNFKVVR